ncbi:hypothetical protein [Streptomyces sp. NPDC054887]
MRASIADHLTGWPPAVYLAAGAAVGAILTAIITGCLGLLLAKMNRTTVHQQTQMQLTAAREQLAAQLVSQRDQLEQQLAADARKVELEHKGTIDRWRIESRWSAYAEATSAVETFRDLLAPIDKATSGCWPRDDDLSTEELASLSQLQ